MSIPIEAGYASGRTIYTIIHNPDGTVWNNNLEAFETYNSDNWADYAIVMAEQANSGYYIVALPAGISGILPTEAIYEQAGLTPALTDAESGPIAIGQSQGVNVESIVKDLVAADNMRASLGSELQGAAVAGVLSATQMTTDLTSSVDGAFAGRLLVMLSGALIRQVANITNYNGTTKMLTFTNLTSAPIAGDTFIIV